MKKFFIAMFAAMMLTLLSPIVSASETTFSIGSTVQGEISEDNQTNYHKFTLEKAGTINLELTVHNKYLWIRILDENDETVWYSNSEADGRKFADNFELTAGTYYFQVERPYSPNYGKYQFAMNFTSANESFPETQNGSNNKVTDASSITLGEQYNGQIAYNDKIDFYTFLLTESGTVDLSVIVYNNYKRLDILDENGENVWYNNSEENGKNFTSSIELTSGTYYFSIEKGYSNDYGNYQFSLNFTSANETFPEVQNGNNNKVTEANTITLGEQYNGQIAHNDTADFYTFTLPDSGAVDVSFVTQNEYVGLFILDRDGEKVWNSNSEEDGKKFTSKVELTSGTYYFSVGKGKSNYYGNYEFSLNFTSAKETFKEAQNGSNNKVTEANSVALGKQYSGQIAMNDSADFYSFTIAKDEKVNISFIANDEYLQLEILDKNGDDVWRSNSKEDGETLSEDIELTAGSYYLNVYTSYSNYGNYNFTLSTIADKIKALCAPIANNIFNSFFNMFGNILGGNTPSVASPTDEVMEKIEKVHNCSHDWDYEPTYLDDTGVWEANSDETTHTRTYVEYTIKCKLCGKIQKKTFENDVTKKHTYDANGKCTANGCTSKKTQIPTVESVAVDINGTIFNQDKPLTLNVGHHNYQNGYKLVINASNADDVIWTVYTDNTNIVQAYRDKSGNLYLVAKAIGSTKLYISNVYKENLEDIDVSSLFYVCDIKVFDKTTSVTTTSNSYILAAPEYPIGTKYIKYNNENYLISIPNKYMTNTSNTNINDNGWKTIKEEVLRDVSMNWGKFFNVELEGLGFDDTTPGQTNMTEARNFNALLAGISFLNHSLTSHDITQVKLIFQKNINSNENRVLILLCNTSPSTSPYYQGLHFASASYGSLLVAHELYDKKVRSHFPELNDSGKYDIMARFSEDWVKNADCFDRYLYFDDTNAYVVSKLYPDDEIAIVNYKANHFAHEYEIPINNIVLQPISYNYSAVEEFTNLMKKHGYNISNANTAENIDKSGVKDSLYSVSWS